MSASTGPDRVSRIRALLQERFRPLAMELIDESDLHAGHPGAREGGHFRLRIVAVEFGGVPTIKRHQLIYAALADLMRKDIHALSIDARAPSEIQDSPPQSNPIQPHP